MFVVSFFFRSVRVGSSSLSLHAGLFKLSGRVHESSIAFGKIVPPFAEGLTEAVHWHGD